MVKFIRRIWKRYSKLGRKRKKKQKWRRPSGRDNKMREKRRGYPAVVSVGYRTDKKIRNKILGKYPRVIYNVKELQDIKKEEIAIVGKIGKKKKIEIVKKAQEKKIPLYNINVNKFLKELKTKEK